ncbi:sugar phosphate isomerase/epimerase [Deltaproteobacteria bacterium Smac51]|nr:sugar phosphate isomerase/epimerase [Deltaproteobacteria bacterium Smac51]
MNSYATLLIKWLPAERAHLDYMMEKKLFPEVGMEHGGLDYPPEGHRELASSLKDHGLRAAVHLPFFGLVPGSADEKLWRRSLDRLLRAAEIASWYGADHLIGHPEFSPLADGERLEDNNKPSERWLERSVLAWEKVLGATDARLYLENTDDQTPEAILSLLTHLPERAGMCFDVGHWYFAAHGRYRRNLADWLEPMAASRRLGHLHLHDNDGDADRHWGLGQGGIDFHAFFDLMKTYGHRPTFTLEAHRLESLKQSQAWLENDPRGIEFVSVGAV